jgi:hypothetical protein
MALPTTARPTLGALICAVTLLVSGAFRQAATAALVTAVRPDHLESSRNEQPITLVGKGFVPGGTIALTDPAGTAHEVPASAITDVKPTSVRLIVTLQLDGDYSIVVTNPAGTPSNAFGFHVGPR